jgi:release factor glutamine methyltransferase
MMHPASIQALLAGHHCLASDNSRLDVELLLCDVLDKNRAFLRAWPEHQLNAAQLSRFTQLLQRRGAGEPIAYLLGRREFWSLDLQVNASTLIPRPATETLVVEALALYPDAPMRVLELGTGSGAIALALACERPSWEIDAVDIAPECVALARANAAMHGLANVRIEVSDWFGNVRGNYHMILSNPPYIDPLDHHLDVGDVRFEPRRALVADNHGLAALADIIQGANGFLQPGGYLLVEHGFAQREACSTLFAAGRYSDITCVQDLDGNDRVTLGRRPVG